MSASVAIPPVNSTNDPVHSDLLSGSTAVHARATNDAASPPPTSPATRTPMDRALGDPVAGNRAHQRGGDRGNGSQQALGVPRGREQMASKHRLIDQAGDIVRARERFGSRDRDHEHGPVADHQGRENDAAPAGTHG